MPAAGPSPRAALRRAEPRRFLEVFALAGFAVAQPVLDVFGRTPELFVFRRASTADVVGFAAVLAVVPAVAVWLPLALAGQALPPLRRPLQVAAVGALAAAAASVAAQQVSDAGGAAVTAIALLAGAGFAAAYLWLPPVQTWLAFAAAAPALFVALFLGFSPVADLVWADDLRAAEVTVRDPAARVVVLVLDEFPVASILDGSGRIDADLYPGFARLAEISTWYPRATTVATDTPYAVPAILTGQYPVDGRHSNATRLPHNLFTLLAGTYDVVADEAITTLCPPNLCRHAGPSAGEFGRLLRDARDAWRQQVSPGREQRDVTATLAEQVTFVGEHAEDPGDAVRGPERFEAFLDAIRPGGRPALHYLHLLLPHVPFRFFPSGAAYDPPALDPGRAAGFDRPYTTASPWPAALARQRHLLQTRYVDGLVSRLLDDLARDGLLDRSLLVVVADHGITFAPGASPRGGAEDGVPDEWPDILSVPLFVKAPGQADGAVDHRNVETVDVLPTVADLLGVDVPWRLDGESLLRRPRRDPDVKRFSKSWFREFGSLRAAPLRAVDASEAWARTRAHAAAHFRGPGGARWSLHRVGPRPELVGRRVASFATGDPSSLATLFPRSVTVDGSGIVPGVWSGRVEPAPAEPVTLALAVDGTIAAVAPTFPDGAGAPDAFALLAPDFVWHEGANEVALYEVRGATLHPLHG